MPGRAALHASDEILTLQDRRQILVSSTLLVVLGTECERCDGARAEATQRIANYRQRVILAVVVADEVTGLGVP